MHWKNSKLSIEQSLKKRNNMRFTMDYTGSKQGFDLKQDLSVDVKEDAEALGYITMCLFEAANVLSKLMEDANPKYHDRLSVGLTKAHLQKESENNQYFPFTTFVVKDE